MIREVIEMTQICYPRDKTGLVLVDVLNDFLDQSGKLYESIAPMLDRLDFKENVRRLLEGARVAGVVIFYSPHGIDEHSFGDVKHMLPRMQWAMDNRVLWIGTPGDSFYEPLGPKPGEVVISHHRMFDSFIGTDLDVQLRAHGIEYVVLAGLTSHTCIEGTGRHALEAGYHVTFLKDAVAEFTQEAHDHAVAISYPTFGHQVLTVDEFLAAVALTRAGLGPT